MRKSKLELNLQNVVFLGVVSIIAVIGVVFCGLYFLNIDIHSTEPVIVLSSSIGLSSILWLFLVYRNC